MESMKVSLMALPLWGKVKVLLLLVLWMGFPRERLYLESMKVSLTVLPLWGRVKVLLMLDMPKEYCLGSLSLEKEMVLLSSEMPMESQSNIN